MKNLIRKTISLIFSMLIMYTLVLNAFAEVNFSKEDITWELFDQYWYDSAPGTENPECSFEYHIFSDWLNKNYEKPKSESGVWRWYKMYDIQHAYKEYYEEYTKDWHFNDDGEFTIQDKETRATLYRFELIDGMWHMIDMSGNTVDVFEPHGGNGEWVKKIGGYGGGNRSNRNGGGAQNDVSDEKDDKRTNDLEISKAANEDKPATGKTNDAVKATQKAAEGKDQKARVTGEPAKKAEENSSSQAPKPNTAKKTSSSNSIIWILAIIVFGVVIVFLKRSKGGKR